MRLAPAISLLFMAMSCASAPSSQEERAASSRAAIVNGTPSDASQDAVVLVMHYDALQSGANGCSGTLLTPRLVLTARHCVAITDPGAACDSDGKPIAGGVVQGDHKPDRLFVFTGKDRPNFIAGAGRAARGEEILTTGAKNLCDNDIALIYLDAPIEGSKIAPIRLDEAPGKSEIVTAVGWGLDERSAEPKFRMQRAGMKITAVGPAEALGPHEFKTTEGTCSGDSGGPVLAESGAVLGALSRGGNGSDGPGAAGCIDAENVFTSVSAHADFIRAGYQKAGQEPWLEGQPNPLLATFGGECVADEGCQSNVCDVGAKICSQDCTSSACPSGWSCAESAGRRLCVESPPDEGCTVARLDKMGARGSESSSGSVLLVALAAIVLAACSRRGLKRECPTSLRCLSTACARPCGAERRFSECPENRSIRPRSAGQI